MSELVNPRVNRRAGRRQHVAVLFTDLRGSTALGRQMEPELFADMLSRVREIWHRVAVRHGGLVVRTQGDGALVVFHHPDSTEDDGRRAVDAALEMHEAMHSTLREASPVELPSIVLRSGIHAGIVLLEDGDVERGRLDLNGDVVNVAAHLQVAAPEDGIAVSTDALGPYARLYELDVEVDPPVDGVKAYLVKARGNAQHRFDAIMRRGFTPFIGRTDVLETLARFVAGTDAGAPACCVVQAGPGLGKTRLLDEFLSRHLPPQWRVIRGNCDSLGATRPLQAIADMLRVTTAPADHESALKGLREACAPGPTLLVIDDWQWADDASSRLVTALLGTAVAAGTIRVLLTARPRDDGGDWIADVPHLTLAAFDARQTVEAVRQWLPAADPFLAARIHEWAGGVPLYVEELCHSAAANQLWQNFDGRPVHTGWLGGLVASRLARLPPQLASVVRTAAVIGTVVPLPLLAACCDEQPSPAVIMRLADADFLYPHGDAGQCLRFKHGITRDAVYNSIGLFERTEMHRRIETSLLARQGGSSEAEDSEALAYHAAGAGHWSLASKAAEQAGDRASAAHAMDSARRQYRASLDALDRLPARDDAADARWCALAAKLAFACVFDPLSLPDGLAIFERAVQLARLRRDARALAHAIYWLGYLLYSVGRFREAAEPLQEALDIAHEVGDNRLAAQLQATLGQALAGAGDYSRAIGLMDAALDHKRAARRPRGGFAVGSAYTLGCLAYVHADQGDFARAQQAFDEALGLLGDSSHPVVTSTRNWLAIALLWQGRWAEARLVAEESVRVATGTRALLLLACSRAVLGFARWNLGEPAGVEQLREAVRWMSARHCDFYASLFNGWLAEAAAASGDDEALHAALRVVRQRSRAGERLGEAALWRAFALRAHFSGRTAAARRWLRRAGRTGAQRGSLREAALNALLQAVFESDAGGLEQAHASIGELGIAALPQPYAGLIPRAAS